MLARERLISTQDKKTLTLAGRWETNNAVENDIAEMVRFGYPQGYWDSYPQQLKALDRQQIIGTSQSVLQPDKLIWVVVGDRAKIEADIKALDFGPISYLDADGNPLGDSSASR